MPRKSHPSRCPGPLAIVALTVSMTAAMTVATSAAPAQAPGAGPSLGDNRITQDMITSGLLPLHQVRAHGLRMFATPFNKLDGYGDGPMNPLNTVSPGGRPTLQNNGTLLRVNGLDAQTCMECHSVVSAAEVPFRFGIGGAGGSNNNVMFQPRDIDVADHQGNGFAAFNGRFINPPFLFGSGGVELLAKEMTADLQARKLQAQQQPGAPVSLVTKGVDFGTITFSQGTFDTSQVVGVDEDLVVRPFGRKGEFATVRAFDVDAMMFHFGMQPVERFGAGDDDGDGVTEEVLVGELSALSIFLTTLERPFQEMVPPRLRGGRELFEQIGCADCHRPSLETDSRLHTYSFPEVATDPSANVYYAVDLSAAPPRFERAAGGGLRVELFSDLKRHDMGLALAESTGGHLDPMFVTARLWGVADTAPYLHDGRALTLRDAIMLHGGEAQAARDGFAALPAQQQERVIAFLQSLRTPRNPAAGLDVRKL